MAANPSGQTLKATAHLGVDLGHADRRFSWVVGDGHVEVGGEPGGFGGDLHESCGQVVAGGFEGVPLASCDPSASGDCSPPPLQYSRHVHLRRVSRSGRPPKNAPTTALRSGTSLSISAVGTTPTRSSVSAYPSDTRAPNGSCLTAARSPNAESGPTTPEAHPTPRLLAKAGITHEDGRRADGGGWDRLTAMCQVTRVWSS